jgi:hypothetical protein
MYWRVRRWKIDIGDTLGSAEIDFGNFGADSGSFSASLSAGEAEKPTNSTPPLQAGPESKIVCDNQFVAVPTANFYEGQDLDQRPLTNSGPATAEVIIQASMLGRGSGSIADSTKFRVVQDVDNLEDYYVTLSPDLVVQTHAGFFADDGVYQKRSTLIVTDTFDYRLYWFFNVFTPRLPNIGLSGPARVTQSQTQTFSVELPSRTVTVPMYTVRRIWPYGPTISTTNEQLGNMTLTPETYWTYDGSYNETTGEPT